MNTMNGHQYQLEYLDLRQVFLPPEERANLREMKVILEVIQLELDDN